MTPGQRGDAAVPAARPELQGRPPKARAQARAAQEGALLQGLAQAPLVSATDLTTAVGRGAIGNIRRHLRALQEAGLVEYVTPRRALLTPQRLYYLTGRGVHQAALDRGERPAAYARRWDLGEGALLRRLARLEHLLLTRGFLLDLHRGLRAEGAVTLAHWRPWPVHWTFDAEQGRRQTLQLDGVGALAQPGAQAEAAFVLLWDDADVDVDALRPRLRAILEARAAQVVISALAPSFPTILLVSTSPARAAAAHQMDRALARDLGVEPLDLVTTADGATLVTSATGPLDAAVCWQGDATQERDLVGHLLVRMGRPAALPGGREGGGETARRSDEEGGVGSDGTAAGPVRGRFAARATSLPATWGPAPTAGDLALVSLALWPREERALRWIGLQPLCRARELAELTQDSPRRMGRTLTRLLSLRLIEGDLTGSRAIPAWRRYILTFSGLRLLAAGAGLAPGAYLHYTGSSAAARETRPAGAGGGEQRSAEARGRRRGRYLAWMARYAEHTAGMQALYLQFVRAARESGGAHALDEWRGEWACARRFAHDGAWQLLRPDAMGRYRAGTEELSFFVELDRGTYGARALGAKLAAYSAYRASRAWAQGSLTFPTVLVVTTGEGRLRTILARNLQVAAARLARPLELLVTTREALDRHGLHGPIWRAAVSLPPRSLFPAPPRLASGSARRLSRRGDAALEHALSCPAT